MVISTDYKWARNKHLSAARVEDIIWSEMHCVWHWATQTPCGIFHSLLTLLAQVRASPRTSLPPPQASTRSATLSDPRVAL